MPFVKGYKWSKNQREKCFGMKGKRYTMSNAHRIASGFVKGRSVWNKGLKIPLTEKQKIEYASRKSRPLTEKQLLGFAKRREQPLTEKQKNAYNRFRGIPWTKEHRDNFEKTISMKPKKPIVLNGKKYPFNWHEIRKEIYKRDGYRCQECGVHCQGKDRNKNRIQCHHIDYDINNNNLSNLITLCASCHIKTNYKKTDWIYYYLNKLN